MISACVIFCVSFGFIQTAPNPLLSNYESVEYNELFSGRRNLIPSLTPEAVFLRPLEPKTTSNDDVYREGNDFISLPTGSADSLVVVDPLPQSSYFEHGIQAALPLEYGSVPQNEVLWDGNYNSRTTYETDPGTYNVDQGIAGSQEADLYPFVHTSVSAALNPVRSVQTLPPAYATHIHESMPSLETRADDYDIDVLNPENSELMPPNLRISRSRPNYLEELTHDAMMNNLLPTMPVPFVRGAERSPTYHQLSKPAVGHRTGQLIAVFPTSKANNCAIPILLRCSPNVIRGALTGSYAEQSPPVSSGAAYREDMEQFKNKSY